MNLPARRALTDGWTSAILPWTPQRDASHLQMYQFGKIETERGGPR